MNFKYAGSIFVAITNSFQLGFNTAIISSVLLALRDSLSKTQQGFLVSCILIGSLLGSFILPPIQQKYGYRMAIHLMLLGNVVLGLLLSLATQSYASIVIYRTLLGVFSGASFAVTPAYIAEISRDNHRGSLGTLRQFAVTSGIAVSFFWGYFILSLYPRDVGSCDLSQFANQTWRWMFLLGALLPSLSLVLSFVALYESPRWLQRNGFTEQAIQIKQEIEQSGHQYLPDNDLNPGTPSQQDQQIQIHKFRQLSLLFTSEKSALIQALALQAFQQFSGINVLIFYSGIIFKMVGFSDRDSLLAGGLSGVPQLLVLFVLTQILDKFQRKSVLQLSMLTFSLSMAAVGACAVLPTDTRKWLCFGLVLLARMSFSLALGPLPPIVASELFSDSTRSLGMALCSALNLICNILVSQSYLALYTFELKYLRYRQDDDDDDGGGNMEEEPAMYTFWLYTLITLIGLVYVRYFVTETRNMSLSASVDEQIIAVTVDAETPLLSEFSQQEKM
ncbi:hypothetical protein MIR68_003639 [Amoeboaphelidium protococcarum]|nr:hypothetical protein MIR68_003639 [Amoeboaphelidium protococcarum]